MSKEDNNHQQTKESVTHKVIVYLQPVLDYGLDFKSRNTEAHVDLRGGMW